MRYLVIGAGVLGCNMAAAWYEAGKDVTLLARGAWYEEIRTHGLKIKNRIFPKTKVYPIPVIDRLEPDDFYDVIFVSLRFTQLDTIYETLHRNASKNIIFNGNNTRTQDVLRNLPLKNVMFSFASAAGSRDEHCVNSISMKKITIGDTKGGHNEMLIRDIYAGTGYKISYVDNMADYLLCHAAFIVPLANAAYYANGDLRRIKNDKAYLNSVVDEMIENYAAIEKAGHEILPEEDKAYATEAWRKKVLRFCRLMCATPLGRICISDHAMNAREEMEALGTGLLSTRTYPAGHTTL